MKNLYSFLSKEERTLVIVTVLVKVCVLFFIFAGFHIFPFNGSGYLSNFIYPQGAQIGLRTAFATWDGQLIMFLAEQGYAANEMTNAQYPLYPLMLSVLNELFFGDTLIAGLVLSGLLSIASVLLLYRFTERLYGSRTAFTACLLFLAFPTSFYTSLLYSESLLIMLLTAFFYFLYTEKFWPLLIAAFLLPASRPQGILVLAPLIWHTGCLKMRGDRIGKQLIVISAAAGGFASYLFLMYCYTGSFFAGFDAQQFYISKHSFSYFFDIPRWFTDNFIAVKLTVHGFNTSIIDRAFFVLALLALVMIYKSVDRTLFVFSLAMVMIPALSDHFTAYTRYLLPVFPVYIMLARKLDGKYYYSAVPMAVIQAMFLIAHSLNHWVA